MMLLELAAQAEGTDEGMQGRVLEEAWEASAKVDPAFRAFAMSRPPRGFDNYAGKFAMALEAMAFESAALMLVPEDGFGSLIGGRFPDGKAGFVAVVTRPSRAEAQAFTPALALCAAALRVRATKETPHG